MIRRFSLLSLLVCVGLVLPASAMGAVRAGSASDPAGDAEAQFDIVRTSVNYSSGGSATATISLAAEPQPGSLIVVVVGSGPKSRDCFSNSALVLGLRPGEKAFAVLKNDRLKAKAKVNGSRLTISTRGPKIAGQSWNCASSAVGPADAEIASDLLDRPIALRSRK